MEGLPDRLKEVQIDMIQGKNLIYQQKVFVGTESMIAKESTDNSPILLLNMSLIIFLIRSGSGKDNFVLSIGTEFIE